MQWCRTTLNLDAQPLFQALGLSMWEPPHSTVDGRSWLLLFSDLVPVQTDIRISSRQILVIDLAGSTILDATHGFALSDCQRVTLTNFQTDYINPPYTRAADVGRCR
jgi:hypothetical protein